ncbi:FYVE zinc finger-domain-containing protein [Aspergillus heterothallicus]
MSSFSSSSHSAHSASSPPTNLNSGFRFHGSSDHLRIREAGPTTDQRIERRRSTLSGPDRKRRLINADVTAGLSYVRRPSVIGTSSRRAEMDSRPIQSSSSHLRPETPLPGSSYETAIDISSSPPEAPTLDRRRHSLSRRDSQYSDSIRPQWQPDSEVTECPICGAAFSFWYRKHHCRKCGRVVCASCSPHRITIPRQYIVHPPTSAHPSASALAHRATQMVNLEGDVPTQSPVVLNPALGGGEEVRLCNPCVPDPNPEPPLGYPPVRPPAEPSSGTGWMRHRSYHSMSNPSRQHPYTSIPDSFTSRPTRRTVGSSDYPFFSGFGGTHTPSFQGRPISYGSMSSSRLPAHPNPGRHSLHFPYGGPSSSPPEPSGSSMTVPRVSRGTHSRPSQAVDECDLCPICDNVLPPIGVNGNEDAREAHIRGCIENHGRPASGSPVSPSPLPVRMLAFTATEKDCIGQDGTEQECTICMEEYEVGQSLVRLECLCKFHKRCIVEWFERKKECPVHKSS